MSAACTSCGHVVPLGVYTDEEGRCRSCAAESAAVARAGDIAASTSGSEAPGPLSPAEGPDVVAPAQVAQEVAESGDAEGQEDV